MRIEFPFYFFAALLLISCHKSERDEDQDRDIVVDANNFLCWDNDILNQLHMACDSLSAVNKFASTCASVSVSGSTYPKTVTIDFGNSPCAGPDGHTRQGQITAVFSGKYKDSLSTVIVSSTNFYVNGNKVKISKTLINKGRNTNAQMWWTVNSHDTLTLTNLKTIVFSSSMKRIWFAGVSTTGVYTDDEFIVRGTANGTGSRGNYYDLSITDDMFSVVSTPWYKLGILTLNPANESPRYLDFGRGGQPDKYVDLKLNGHTETLELP